MKPVVVLAGDSASADQFERAGVTVIRATDAEDAVRVAAANELAAIVLDRQLCGGLELVAAVSQLAADDGRSVVVIDHNEGSGGDELTHALRQRAQVAVCRGGADAVAAVRSRGPRLESRPAITAHGRSSAERTVAVLQPQVLPVVSAKGGVGKTTVATNLAVILAKSDLARTVLADFALTNSDVSVCLDLPDGPDLTEIMTAPERLSEIPCHTGANLHVLPGLARPEDGEKLEQQQVEAVLAGLRKQYEIAVLDLATDPTSDLLYYCIEQASSVILVSTLDAASLKDTRLFLNVLKRLNVKVVERVRLVLNRVRTDSTMDPARAEEFLGLGVACAIPDDPRSIDAAAYAGVPLVLSRPNHAIAQALWQLAGSISPAFERPGAAKAQGFWRRNRS